MITWSYLAWSVGGTLTLVGVCAAGAWAWLRLEAWAVAMLRGGSMHWGGDER